MADHLIAQLGRLGLTLDKTGATLVLYPDSATGATVPLKAASTASLSGRVAVKLAAYPAAMPEGGLLPFLVVPAATDLSGVAFDWQGVGYGQPVGEIVVSDPMDGFVTVSAKLSTIAGPVTPTTGGSAATYFEKASHWSDGLVHHATNYLVTGHSNVRATSSDWVHTWECKADTVTLVDSRFFTKQRNRLYFKDLRLYGNSRLGIGSRRRLPRRLHPRRAIGEAAILTRARVFGRILMQMPEHCP